jgi:adenylate cyclase
MVKLHSKMRGRRLQRRLLHALILIAVGGLFSLAIALVQPFHTFNLWFADQFLDSEAPSTNIVIASIDDASLKAYGKWSQWRPSLHTEALNNLAKAGASVIGFDVVFADSSPDDQSFGEAIKNAGNVVLVVAGTDRLTENEPAISFRDFLYPATPLKQSCSNLGHANIIADPDGKVRRIPLFIRQSAGDAFPSFSLAVLYTLFHKPVPDSIMIKENKLNLLMRDIPVDSSYLMRINYAIEDNSLTNISYSDIINNNFDSSLVKNKIVLIGMTATGDLDTWSIPNAAIPVSGVLVHAAAIDTILRTRFLTEVGNNTTLLIMLMLVLICALLLPRFGTWYWTDVLKGTALIIGLLMLYVVSSAFLSQRGYILNILYPALTLIVLYLANILYIVVKEQSDKRFVKSLFGRYVSPQISKEIVCLANDGKLNLGGEEKEVTVLFADIRNFTTISERMSPEEVVNMLNSCLPILIDAIVRNGGLVNKFAGDNLMGVWNAPQNEPEHPISAITAAFEAQKEMTGKESGDIGRACVQFGIGINTGKVLAGNVGSLGRAEYTVIGDTVNIASRICGIAQGGQILIGPDTYSQAKDFLEVEALEPQIFKGKSKPVPVYLVKRMRNISSLKT